MRKIFSVKSFLVILFLFTASCVFCSEKSKKNSETLYLNNMTSYKEDISNSKENQTAYKDELTSNKDDLTAYAKDSCYRYFGEYVNGVYTLQLQSESYIEAYLEVNGVQQLDFEKMLAQFCVGAGTIVITAVVLPALPAVAGVAAFSSATPLSQVCIIAIKLTKDSIIGAAMDAAMKGAVEYYKTGNVNRALYSSAEAWTEGFMWGAVFSSAMETVKEVKFVHQSLKEKNQIIEGFRKKILEKNPKISENEIKKIIDNDIDDIIRKIKNSSVDRNLIYKFYAAYPDNAEKLLEEYSDKIIEIFDQLGAGQEQQFLKLLEEDGDDLIEFLKRVPDSKISDAIDVISDIPLNKRKVFYEMGMLSGDDATNLCKEFKEEILNLFEKVDAKQREKLIKIIKRDGKDAINILKKVPDSELSKTIDFLIDLPTEKQNLVYKFIKKMGINARKYIEKYGDDILILFEKYGDEFVEAFQKLNPEQYKSFIYYLKQYPEYATVLNKGRTDIIISVLEKAGVTREESLLQSIKLYGDEVVDILVNVPRRDLRRTIDFFEVFDLKTYKRIAKNGLPDEITSQVIRDSKTNPMLKDAISGKLKNPKGEIVSYVRHEDRYLNPYTQELKPNIVYRTGEGNYYYQTDEYGRIIKARTSKLRLQEDIRKTDVYERDPHNGNTPDKEIDDDAGHVIAGRFGGSSELDNLVSQNSNLNRGTWKKMENKWVKDLQDGKEVQIEIEIVYEGSSKRPAKYIVKQNINGKIKTFEFLNI